MSQSDLGMSAAVLALREEFDRGFAQAPRMEAGVRENLLAIRLGADGYAIRVAEIGGLFADKRIMPVPTAVAALLGVAGFRGQIAPVYDLAALLGHAPQLRQAPPRWLVLARLRDTVALAFDIFDGHFSIAQDHIVKAADAGRRTSQPHLLDAARADGGVRPIIHLQSLLENIQRQTELSSRQRSTQT